MLGGGEGAGASPGASQQFLLAHSCQMSGTDGRLSSGRITAMMASSAEGFKEEAAAPRWRLGFAMTSIPKPRELPGSRRLNSQPALRLERMGSDDRLIKLADRRPWADQAASTSETTLRCFPLQKDRSRSGAPARQGKVRQSRVCPLLDTYPCLEVSTLKVFGGGSLTNRFIVTSSTVHSARRKQGADRATAEFYTTGQKTGSNEILEKRCAAPRPITPCGPLGLPLLLLPPLQDFTDKDTNGTNSLLLITHGELTVRLRRFFCEPVNAG